MRNPRQPQTVQDVLTSHFWSGDAIRSRSVSDLVLSGLVDIPSPAARLTADWEREVLRLGLEPGDVEALSLARARARWPDFRRTVQSTSEWARSLGLHEALAESDMALMACRGARYHHDGEQYGSAAFCNLFLSEDMGLDVHFFASGDRIPLRRGTAIIFDTCQPHGVVQRGGESFDPVDFASLDCTQVFLTWELPIEDAHVARMLGVTFDVDPATSLQMDEEQVRRGGKRLRVCPQTGRWAPVEP